jgi:hypothetical protein
MCVCIYCSLRYYGGKEGGREGWRALLVYFGVDGWLGGVVCREGGREGGREGRQSEELDKMDFEVISKGGRAAAAAVAAAAARRRDR